MSMIEKYLTLADEFDAQAKAACDAGDHEKADRCARLAAGIRQEVDEALEVDPRAP